MSTAKEILDSVYGVALWLILIPALWVAGKIVLSQVPGLQGSQACSPSRLKHGTLVLYWFALAGLFILPLSDLLRLSYLLLDTFVSGLSTNGQPVTTTWGSAPWTVFTVMQFLLTLAVYGFVLFYVRGLGEEIRLPYLGENRMTRAERIFILLGIAGLANQLVDATVSRIVWLGLPVLTQPISQGLVGVAVSWILGLLLLTLIYLVVNDRLSSKEDERLL